MFPKSCLFTEKTVSETLFVKALSVICRRDSQSEQSETASTVSQTSYDPSNPNFRNMDSEIPDTVSIDTTESSDGASSGSKSKSSSKGI